MGASSENTRILRAPHTDINGDLIATDYGIHVHNEEDNVNTLAPWFPRSRYEDLVEAAVDGETDLYDAMDNDAGPLGTWWDALPTPSPPANWDYRKGVWKALERAPHPNA